MGVYFTVTAGPTGSLDSVNVTSSPACAALPATATAPTVAEPASSSTAKSAAAGARGAHTGSLIRSVTVVASNSTSSIVGAAVSTVNANRPLALALCPARSVKRISYGVVPLRSRSPAPTV